MAKNITLLGANYPNVPAVQLPQTGGGTATFYDISVIDNLNSDSSTDALSAKQGKVLNGKTSVKAQSIDANSITETCVIRTITGSSNLPDSTNVEGILLSFISYIDGGYVGMQYFHTYATNKVYSRLCWYSTWRSWVQLSN